MLGSMEELVFGGILLVAGRISTIERGNGASVHTSTVSWEALSSIADTLGC